MCLNCACLNCAAITVSFTRREPRGVYLNYGNKNKEGRKQESYRPSVVEVNQKWTQLCTQLSSFWIISQVNKLSTYFKKNKRRKRLKRWNKLFMPNLSPLLAGAIPRPPLLLSLWNGKRLRRTQTALSLSICPDWWARTHTRHHHSLPVPLASLTPLFHLF